MACLSLEALARECGKTARTGFNPDVFLIAFQDTANIVDSTEIYTVSNTGLIDEINLAAGKKFIKVGAVIGQGSLTENYTQNDNGTFDITKELAFQLTGMGTPAKKAFVESLMGNPVVALVKMNSGQWVALGLNGQFQLVTSVGTLDATNNGRVLTLRGQDGELVQPVDPTIVPALLAA